MEIQTAWISFVISVRMFEAHGALTLVHYSIAANNNRCHVAVPFKASFFPCILEGPHMGAM